MARTDAALLLAARTEPAAFRELYERYAEPLHGFHLRRTGDADARRRRQPQSPATRGPLRRARPRPERSLLRAARAARERAQSAT
jgi:hypothetical protein